MRHEHRHIKWLAKSVSYQTAAVCPVDPARYMYSLRIASTGRLQDIFLENGRRSSFTTCRWNGFSDEDMEERKKADWRRLNWQRSDVKKWFMVG